MPRRLRIKARIIPLDAKYHNQILAIFINKIMNKGKKSLAERTIYGSLELIEGQTRKNPLEIFEQAVRNATPILEVKPRRVGGATYQVPVEIKGERRLSLAMRWLIRSARARTGKSMVEKLAAEFQDAAHGTGASVKRRDDTHRMAEANKAFAHYRW